MIEIKQTTSEEYSKIFSITKSSFLQSTIWAKTKNNWTHKLYLIIENEVPIGCFLVLTQKKYILRISYIARGIKLLNDSKIFYPKSTILNLIKEKIKIDIKSDILLIEPDTDFLDFKNFNFGFSKNLIMSNFKIDGESMQPQYTNIIDISKDTNKLFDNLERETRRRVRKYLNVVSFRLADSESDIIEFSKILQELSSYKGYLVRPTNYFIELWNTYKGTNKLFITIMLKDNEIIGGYLNILENSISYELYGGCKKEARKASYNCILKWMSIKMMKEKGALYYDQWGASDNILKGKKYYNIGQFKKNFGGEFIEYLPRYIYIFCYSKYILYKIGLFLNSLQDKLYKNLIKLKASI